jgi:hypothetical protein
MIEIKRLTDNELNEWSKESERYGSLNYGIMSQNKIIIELLMRVVVK